jgi:hypothetical protein
MPHSPVRNRNRDLLACSALLQPTAPSAPFLVQRYNSVLRIQSQLKDVSSKHLKEIVIGHGSLYLELLVCVSASNAVCRGTLICRGKLLGVSRQI